MVHPILIVAWLILLSPLIIIVSLIFFIPWLNIRYIRRSRLLSRVQKEWLPQNKFVLFIYSNNPEWKEYAEENIIPQIKDNAVILNWSERKSWIDSDSLETQLFKNFNWNRKWIWLQNTRSGGQDYNHMAIVFKPANNPKIINFWPAFKDYEFGNKEKMEMLKNELLTYL